ncbi:MAG: ribonuclease HII [candidate division Zixibacteria bacterium]|nr:ribonuclease HII [candidate division Zixibacteria bacterium]
MKMSLDMEKALPNLNHLEEMLTNKGYSAICGVDEVGRGPLAGPVVAAAVILPFDTEIDGLDDSKKLTRLQREQVFEKIADLGLVCAVGAIDNEDIDRMNIHRASLMAMRKAVQDLSQTPDFILVDGNFAVPNISQPQFAVVSGDARCRCVAAASVVAKVVRDSMMDKMQSLYPAFSFSKHKGYPTQAHLEELKLHGPCEIHRKSFKPVADLLEEYTLA